MTLRINDCIVLGDDTYQTPTPVHRQYVHNFFEMKEENKQLLHFKKTQFGYGAFGEFIFYRTYSRIKNESTNEQENWADCVIRVIEGVMSIRKDWYIKINVKWHEKKWQDFALRMAMAMFDMKWLPAGRGLWAMGTDYVYQRGSMSLFNCAATAFTNFPKDAHWLMDGLMNGVGVGFECKFRTPHKIYAPHGDTITVIIDDSREGWCDSVQILLESYMCPNMQPVKFDYSAIRPKGSPIRKFGGLASGPDPLCKLHNLIRRFCKQKFEDRMYTDTQFIADIINNIGCCVVAGNVRRSAEIAVGMADDPVFVDLKNEELYPERQEWAWMSNNSIRLEENKDFELLPEIAKRVIKKGEPGFINKINIERYGRVNKEHDFERYNLRKDKAGLINPCGEIPLEDKELCNLSETLPTRCDTPDEWFAACRFALFYVTTVALLPTHRQETNVVIMKNRRVGVGIVDVSGWKHKFGATKITKWMKEGYKCVRRFNKQLADEAGVPESIRVTTIKPGGTTPKLAGVTSGIGHPTFIYTIRRVRVQEGSPIEVLLKKANVPNEPDKVSDNTTVFEFPIKQGPAKPATEVSLWEQAMNVVMVQREWADNAVSNTLYFKKEEEDDVEPVLAAIAPLTKSISLLPHTNQGVYEQMPEEGCTKEEYEKRLTEIREIDWTELKGSHGIDEKYCRGDTCELPVS